MKRYLSILLVGVFLLFGISSCYTHHRHGHIPPGKAKKVYGDKSAKRYAPGQQKKYGKKNSKGKKGRGQSHKMDYHYNAR